MYIKVTSALQWTNVPIEPLFLPVFNCLSTKRISADYKVFTAHTSEGRIRQCVQHVDIVSIYRVQCN